MRKYRMCSGLAIMPDRDMKMLKEMSQKGWHLSGMKNLMYCFEEGEPHDYDYALNLEGNVDAEMLAIYEISGWLPIVAENGYQIFRAESGTSPIFSDVESELEILDNNRKSCGKWAGVFGVMLLICLLLSVKLDIILLEIAALVLMVCFVFTFMPFVGFSVSLNKKRK